MEPHGRQSYDRAVGCPFGFTHGFLLSDKVKSNFGQRPSGEFRADGTLPTVRVIGSWRPCAQSDSFAPLWAKESRGSGGGFLKGGTVGDSLEGRSFGPFLSPRRERDIAHR